MLRLENLNRKCRLVGCRLKARDMLTAEENDFKVMVDSKYKHYHSSDPLDLGEALWLSHWELSSESNWALEVSKRSATALDQLWSEGYFKEPPGFRLAFRELGTTLGAQVNEVMSSHWERRVGELHQFWATRILDRDSDISPVMMASSLVPCAWNRRFEDKISKIHDSLRSKGGQWKK